MTQGCEFMLCRMDLDQALHFYGPETDPRSCFYNPQQQKIK